MASLLQDLRYGFRQLLRNRVYAGAAVLTLALGIGATSALFSVVHGVLLRALPFERPEQLVLVQTIDRAGDAPGGLSPPNFLSLREESRVLEGLAIYGGVGETLTGVGEPRELSGAEVSAGFFEVLGSAPALGRTIRAGENAPGEDGVVVLGHAAWQRDFGGDPSVIGRAVTLSGRSRTVVGVMHPGFDYPGGRELWVPIAYDERYAADHAVNRRSRWHSAVGRLRPGVTPDAVRADLDGLARRLEAAHQEQNAGVRFAAVPLREHLVAGTRTPLLVLFGAVGLVLLIACANVAGLLLARNAARRGELGVRASLGASRGRLVRQLMAESVALSLIGGAVGLLLAWWGVQGLLALRPEGLPRQDEIRLDGTVAAFTFAVTILTATLAGALPALRATSGALAPSLREGGRARSGLVVAELTGAVVLLAAAGLLLRSLLALLAVDPGFQTEGVLTFSSRPTAESHPTSADVTAFHDRMVERAAAIPGVQAAAAVWNLPIEGGPTTWRVEVEGLQLTARGAEPEIQTRFITPEYFRAMGIPLHRGRAFDDRDDGTAQVVVINEAAADRFFPGGDAIGRRIESLTGTGVGGTVVGVVGNTVQFALHEPPLPEMYVPHTQNARRRMDMVVRTEGDPLALAPQMAAVIRELDPPAPLPEFRTLREVVGASVAEPRFLAILLSLFAAVAVVMAATGVFGLLSFSVAQRTREIGVRMALGAGGRQVVGEVVRRAVALTLCGLALGLLGTLAVTRLLRGLLYGVAPTDPATLASAVLLLGITALLAAWLPARRAARVDPMTALRAE